MPDNCPLSDDERNDNIRRIMREELGAALNTYFDNAPFKVGEEQHYRDHEFTNELRENLSTVKTSFLKSVGKILVLLLAGGVSWKYLAKYLFASSG